MKRYQLENQLVLARRFIEDQVERAIDHYEVLVQHGPELMTEEDFIQLGFAYEDLGQYLKAQKTYWLLIEEFPKSFRGEYSLAVVYEELKEPLKAVEHYECAIKLNHGFYEAYFYVAGVYDDLGQVNMAVKRYKETLAIKGDHYFAWLNLGSIYETENNLSQAKACFEKALSIEEHYMAYFNLGVVAIKEKRYDLGVDYYKTCIELKADYGYSYLNLSLIYKGQGDYKTGIQILTEGILHAPDESYLYYHRACQNALNANIEAAKADAKQAYERYPGFRKYMLEDKDLQGLRAFVLNQFKD